MQCNGLDKLEPNRSYINHIPTWYAQYRPDIESPNSGQFVDEASLSPLDVIFENRGGQVTGSLLSATNKQRSALQCDFVCTLHYFIGIYLTFNDWIKHFLMCHCYMACIWCVMTLLHRIWIWRSLRCCRIWSALEVQFSNWFWSVKKLV